MSRPMLYPVVRDRSVTGELSYRRDQHPIAPPPPRTDSVKGCPSFFAPLLSCLLLLPHCQVPALKRPPWCCAT
jgi:hypothetical protein